VKLAVPTETLVGERRVAIVPEAAGRLSGSGVDVFVQAGAGSKAHFSDAAYRENGADVVEGADDLLHGSDVVVKVHAPAPTEVQHPCAETGHRVQP